MKNLSLTATVYLMLAPLAVMGLAMGFYSWTSVRSNAKQLNETREVKELAVTSLALLLTQDDASKALILDPDHSAAGARKIKAYDANRAVLTRISSLSDSAGILSFVRQLRELDERELRPLDTSLLEMLGDGKLEKARQYYFIRYEPARARYEALERKLGDAAERRAQEAGRHLERQSRISSSALGVGGGLLALAMILLARALARTRNIATFCLRCVAEATGAEIASVRQMQANHLEQSGAAIRYMGAAARPDSGRAGAAQVPSAVPGVRQTRGAAIGQSTDICGGSL